MTDHATPAPLLDRADRTLGKLETALNYTAAISIFLLMITATVQVLSRKLLNLPIPGYIDIAEQSIAVFAFLAIAYCQRLGGHVRMEIIIARFQGRPLWLSEALQTLVTMILIGVLAWYAYGHFERAWEIGDSTIDIQLPTWPSKLMVPVAFAVLLVRLAIQLVGFIRLAITPDATPVAVPLVVNVEEVAKTESALSEAEQERQKQEQRHDKS